MLPSGFNVGIPWQRAENDPTWYERTLKKLTPNCWYNWKNDQTHTAGYIPMLWRCNPTWVANTIFTAQSVGEQLWLLGNEPEAQGQSDTTPQDFVDAAIAWRDQVGGEIALPGNYWGPYGHGKAWLDEYLKLGGPIPDAWACHMYQPTSRHWINSFPDMIEHLRSIADIPILLTECGCSYNDVEHVHAVMEQVKKAIHDGDVQAAFWFSAYYEADMPWNDLLTHDCKLTEIGKHYIGVKDIKVAEQHTVYLPNVHG